MKNQQRILSISKELGLSHIGSNLSCLPILEEIYAKKNREDIVILDNAHAHLAHLIVCSDIDVDLPKKYIEKYGIHCDRRAGCDSSGGSLGHGIGIGIGYALAERNIDRDVYVITSDGSLNEGSCWEALRLIRHLGIRNIFVHVNANGYTAVEKSDTELLALRLALFLGDFSENIKFHRTSNTPEFDGVEGHYKKI